MELTVDERAELLALVSSPDVSAAVLDNLATHITPQVREWLAANPTVHFHLTPIGASWINQIETLVRIITRQSIRRGTS